MEGNLNYSEIILEPAANRSACTAGGTRCSRQRARGALGPVA
jgi:hypothetical protein